MKEPVRTFFLIVVLVAPWTVKRERGTEKESAASAWRPNRATQGISYVGAKACAQCHSQVFESQAITAMGRALEPAAQSRILKSNPQLEFKSGQYSYRITREGERSMYTVTDGAEVISEPILWSFGHGFSGQTYAFQHEGRYYESHVSFFTEVKTLDYTLGHPRQPAASLAKAIGRVLTPDETRRCIGCHSTGAVSGKELHLDQLEPGVRCEACHGPGAKHVSSMKSGRVNPPNIFNPGKLSADALSQEFCGECHRSAEEVVHMEKRGGKDNIRFQPYRIFNSRCYSNDARISCIACHNPHEPLRRESAYYDAKCLACHRKGPSSPLADKTQVKLKGQKSTLTGLPCPVDQRDCVTCHMPKLGLEGSHFEFTDHRIRIQRPGSPYPI